MNTNTKTVKRGRPSGSTTLISINFADLAAKIGSKGETKIMVGTKFLRDLNKPVAAEAAPATATANA